MNQTMVDNETLGTRADAVILSIGACRFDLETGKIDDSAFYAALSIEDQLTYGRRIQEDTLLWWMKQTPAAQKVFHDPKKLSMADALEGLTEWMAKGDPNTVIWANGPDFDLPQLAHAYAQLGWPTPWKFWNSSCVRTYKRLPGASRVKAPPADVKHNALSDAIEQSNLVCAIHAELFGKPTAAKPKGKK